MFFGGFPGFPGGMDGEPGGGRGPRKEVNTTKFYEVLGIDKNAGPAEIRTAYRKLAVKHHPDKGGDPERFKEITRAHEVLSDPEKRKRYDRAGEEGVEEGGGGGDGDIFDMFFGGGGGGGRGGAPKRRKTKDVTQPLKITLEQLYNGVVKKMAITRDVLDKVAGVKECQECNGRGATVQVVRMGPMVQQIQRPCGRCSGQGKNYRTMTEKEILEVHVPKGAPDGHKVVFNEKADEHPDMDPGDVVLVVKEQEHPVFKRKGADLFIERKISLVEALCGFEMELVHLDGRKILITTQPGEVIKPTNYDPLSAEEKETDWEVCEGTALGGDFTPVAKAEIDDPDICKKAAAGQLKRKGLDIVAFTLANGEANFYTGSRDEALQAKVSKSSSTTYLVPCPEKASQQRMMKAVKGEGMPTLRNPFQHGNLFLILSIEFPENLDEKCIAGLRKALPPPLHQPKRTEEHEHVKITDLDPVLSLSENKINMTHGGEAYDDDDEGQSGPGGQRVQCAQQ